MKNKHNYPIDGGFVVLPDDTIRSNAFKGLTPATRCIYFVLLTNYVRDKDKNPMNEVTMDHDDIEDISGLSHGTVVRAMRELKEKGFIKVKQKGSFRRHKAIFIINGRYTQSGLQEARW